MRLIDADALLEKAENLNKKDRRFVQVLMSVCPTIDPESLRPTGEWKTANDGTHFCSRCGCDAIYTWDDIDRNFINSADDVPDSPSNYCPNCGAKTKEAT